MAGRRIPLEERLATRASREGSCLIWNGCKDRDGYALGTFGHGKMFRLTRMIWKEFRREIPEKMLVCHTCDNPSCVELSHLFLGTNRDNIVDMVQKGRHKPRRGERHHMCKLSDQQIREIRSHRANGKTLSEIAMIYGVSFQHVSELCRFNLRKDA